MNNIEKALEGKGDGSERKKLVDLEGELFEVEQNLLDSLRADFEKGIDVMTGENLNQYIRRIKLSEKD